MPRLEMIGLWGGAGECLTLALWARCVWEAEVERLAAVAAATALEKAQPHILKGGGEGAGLEWGVSWRAVHLARGLRGGGTGWGRRRDGASRVDWRWESTAGRVGSGGRQRVVLLLGVGLAARLHGSVVVLLPAQAGQVHAQARPLAGQAVVRRHLTHLKAAGAKEDGAVGGDVGEGGPGFGEGVTRCCGLAWREGRGGGLPPPWCVSHGNRIRGYECGMEDYRVGGMSPARSPLPRLPPPLCARLVPPPPRAPPPPPLLW